jgi:hypothetical protein
MIRTGSYRVNAVTGSASAVLGTIEKEFQDSKGQKQKWRPGAAPAFAAALTSPFFQDNQLNNQSSEFSRKIFALAKDFLVPTVAETKDRFSLRLVCRRRDAEDCHDVISLIALAGRPC